VGGGLAQVDVKSTHTVEECGGLPAADRDACAASGDTEFQSPIGGLPQVEIDAYKKLGQGFVAAGGGAMYGFTPTLSAKLDVAFMFMLPSTGVVLEPSLGLVLAL
jgi:hypothetical protein